MDKEVITAPQELIDRMKALLQRPAPTLEEVKTQWKASAEFSHNENWRKQLGDKYS